MKKMLFLAALIAAVAPAVRAQRVQLSAVGGLLTDKPSFNEELTGGGFGFAYTPGYFAGVQVHYYFRGKDAARSPLGLLIGAQYNHVNLRFRFNASDQYSWMDTRHFAKISIGGAFASLETGVGQASFQLTADYSILLAGSSDGFLSITPQAGFGARGILMTIGLQAGLDKVGLIGESSRAVLIGLKVTPQRWFGRKK